MENIQFEIQKIHSQFGTTEMANYQIQLLAERYAKEYHEMKLKKLRVADVSGRSEQLKALLEKLVVNNMCSHAGDELIEEALKGF